MADLKYGKKSYIGALNPKQQESAAFVLPYLAEAIAKSEDNKRNMGVLSVPTSGPSQASNVLKNSIVNNFSRWVQSRQGELPPWDMPKKSKPTDTFVDFMQKRWAPIPSPNDPKNLNKNWSPNVHRFLMQALGPEEYRRWVRYNMVSE